MKVLWVSHLVPYPAKAGVLIRSNSLIRELSKDCEVDLFMFNQKHLLGSYYEDLKEGIESAEHELSKYVGMQWLVDIASEENTWSKMKLVVGSFFSLSPYTINWLKSKSAGRQIEEIVLQGGYDLVHFDTISLDVFSDALPAGIVKVMDHHNVESHMMQRRWKKEKNVLKKVYFYWEAVKLHQYEKENLRKYNGHILCSENDKQRLLELSDIRSSCVVPNGIDISRISIERRPVLGRLLFVGGLSWYPNLQAIEYFLDKVVPVLDKRNLDYRLDIIGKGAPKSLISKYQSSSKIFFHGFVDDINDFYSESMIYICPILDGGGTKLKVLDAMAHGIPIIATELACEGIEVCDGEHVIIAKTPIEFADSIELFLDHKIDGEAMGGAAAKIVQEAYSFQHIGGLLRGYFKSLVM